ncbi:ATP-binding protein [Streptomyces sp. NPDC006670]|uniref:ATP-binding protein n=1 Tax=Streptomyces sp. NPDC006670 TaxID=3154476 RepID=UPI0033E43208
MTSRFQPTRRWKIGAACRKLGVSTIRGRWEEFATQALREHASYTDFLAELRESKCENRDERLKFRRVKEAGFPRNRRIEDFGFPENPNVAQEARPGRPAPSRQAWLRQARPARHRAAVPDLHRMLETARSRSPRTGRSPRRTCSGEPVRGAA